jgi:hypothetical protein
MAWSNPQTSEIVNKADPEISRSQIAFDILSSDYGEMSKLELQVTQKALDDIIAKYG